MTEPKPTVDNSYWQGRWDRGETGWHQDEVEQSLVDYFGGLKPTRVLVPLCGKSIDLMWLASKGHDVIGVELTSLAVETFFREQKLEFAISDHGSFKRYTAKGPKLTILQGDVFKLQASDVAGLGAVYDRAALIALPLDLRARYAALLAGLVKAIAKPGFQFLELLIERVPHDDDGPPFSITEKMLSDLYGRDFDIKLLEREDAELESATGARSDQCVYLLTIR
jgi:thiopurine S-methyltransferase